MIVSNGIFHMSNITHECQWILTINKSCDDDVFEHYLYNSTFQLMSSLIFNDLSFDIERLSTE